MKKLIIGLLIILCVSGCTYTPDTVQCTVCAVQGTKDGYDTVYVRDAEDNIYTYTVYDIDSTGIEIGDSVTIQK